MIAAQRGSRARRHPRKLRDPERGHDRVVSELLDGQYRVGDDTLLNAVVLHAAARHLGIGAGYESRRSGEIDEEDRRKLAFRP